MKQYFYADGEEQKGPFTIDELKDKKITKSTMVWTEGMKTWHEAGKIEELASILTATPPPLTKKSPVPPPIVQEKVGIVSKKNENSASKQMAETSMPKKSVQPKKKKSAGWIIVLLLIAGIGITGYMFRHELFGGGPGSPYGSGESYDSAPSELSEEELQQQLYDTECSHPADYINGTLNTEARYKNILSMKVNGLKLKFNLTSSATLATIKNIDVRISLQSKTGATFHEQNLTIYEFIKPGGSTTYKSEIDITNQQWKQLSKTTWTITGSDCQ